jgi:hypothetical protein
VTKHPRYHTALLLWVFAEGEYHGRREACVGTKLFTSRTGEQREEERGKCQVPNIPLKACPQ